MMGDESKVVMGTNIEICWSSNKTGPDRFITFGHDLKLHNVEYYKEMGNIYGGVQFADVHISTIPYKDDVYQVKSMACNNTLYSDKNDVLFALGYNNGRILLNHFDASVKDLYPELTGKEFTPTVSRSCNTLDFNPEDNNLLASGFDKARNEHSIMVWDIAHTGTVPHNSMYHSHFTTTNFSGSNKPLYELAQNEVVHSLKWFQSKLIICGMNNKHIKIFDLRDNDSKPKGTITKGVNGITVDPLFINRFASFSDNTIFVWDWRFLENPTTVNVTEASSIVKLEWCPTRSNILAVLLKDTNYLRLYDYKDFKNAKNEPEPAVVQRDISPFSFANPQIISSFSWHPSNESRMLVISTNSSIKDFKVIDRITLNWSPVSEIIWTHGKKILQCIDPDDSYYQNIDDIAVIMRKRASEGYGLATDKMWQFFVRNSPLYNLWKWMSMRIRSLKQEEKPTKGVSSYRDAVITDLFSLQNHERLHGLLSVLFKENRLELLHHSQEASIPENNILSKRKVYTSLSRAKALQHCGWSSRSRYLNNIDLDMNAVDLNSSSQSPSSQSSLSALFDGNMPCDTFVESNEEEVNYTRSAAVMVFNGKIQQAIKCLQKASNYLFDRPNDLEDGESITLNVIALALSSYEASANPKEEDSMWKKTCKNLKNKLRDPYIKAIFIFLSMNGQDEVAYNEIIDNVNLNMDIADKIAFACMFLSDDNLKNYLLKLKTTLFERADLSAILLTGVTTEGLDLFSKYIENTCDVQTISLILLWSLPSSICKENVSKIWIENYKQLLDCWRLWNVRAQFDIKWHAGLNHMDDPKPRIYLSCSYCRNSISVSVTSDAAKLGNAQHMSHHQYNRSSSANTAGSKYRTVSCSNCAKSLPRCSLCLTQLGTPAGIYWRPKLLFGKNDKKLSPFASWFTWCQTCRHGGHSSHIVGWFMDNTVCPVAGCKCKCMSMDANARLSETL